MEQKKRKRAMIALGIVAVGTYMGFVVSKAMERNERVEDDTLTIVTSFYPLYLQTQTLTEGIEGIEVINMVPSEVGCVHDYSLTTEDMKKMQQADVFVLNGMDQSYFIEMLTQHNETVAVIDATADWQLADGTYGVVEAHSHEHEHDETCTHETDTHSDELDVYNQETAHTEDDAHDHDHDTHEVEGEVHDHDTDVAESEAHDHDHDTHALEGEAHDTEGINPHVWLDVEGGSRQLHTIAQALGMIDPSNKAQYAKNLEAAIEALEAVGPAHTHEEMAVVTVHNTFEYLIEASGITVAATIPEGSYENPSPKQIEELIETINTQNIQIIVADRRYADLGIVQTIQAETGCELLLLDDMTNEASNNYIRAMRTNQESLEAMIHE